MKISMYNFVYFMTNVPPGVVRAILRELQISGQHMVLSSTDDGSPVENRPSKTSERLIPENISPKLLITMSLTITVTETILYNQH